jgi:hypothetical protein
MPLVFDSRKPVAAALSCSFSAIRRAPRSVAGFVRYTLAITELSSGEVRAYQNSANDPTRLCGGADTSAFGR